MTNRDSLTLIRGGRLLSPEEGVPDRADILVKNGLIVEIASPGSIGAEGGGVVDAEGMLILPGLVNAHSHGQLNLCKGCNDRWSLELLLNRLPSVTAGRSAEYHYLSAQIGAAEMVSKGCTTVYDLFSEFPAPTPEGVDAVARAYSDIGMRAVVAPMMADRSFYQAIPGLIDAFPDELKADVERIRFAPYQESVERCRQVLKGWRHDRDLVRPALAPTIPHHCTDDFLVACRALADEFDIGIQMHVAESRMQAVVAPMVRGRTAVFHLAELGLLGPRFMAAHSVWIDDEDMARLADHGASVAHNPGSNLRLGSGLARVRQAAEDLTERTAGMRSLAARFEPIVRQYCEGLSRRPLPSHHPCAHRGLEG